MWRRVEFCFRLHQRSRGGGLYNVEVYGIFWKIYCNRLHHRSPLSLRIVYTWWHQKSRIVHVELHTWLDQRSRGGGLYTATDNIIDHCTVHVSYTWLHQKSRIVHVKLGELYTATDYISDQVSCRLHEFYIHNIRDRIKIMVENSHIFVNDFFERIVEETSRLGHKNNRQTISCREYREYQDRYQFHLFVLQAKWRGCVLQNLWEGILPLWAPTNAEPCHTLANVCHSRTHQTRTYLQV